MTIKNILGSVSFELLGDYSASTTYQYLNVIKQNNHWYICQIRGGIINLPPAATFIDNTQWVRFVESGDNSLTSITFKTGGLNNLIDMGRRDLADFEFINGHIIKNFSDSGGVAHRDTLEYKGTDLTVTDTGVVTEVDFTTMDGKISNNTTEIAKLVADPGGNINNITNVSNATPNNADALVFNSTTSAYEPRSLGRVTQIATATDYATRKDGTGWNAGDLMTPSTAFNIIRAVGSPASISVLMGLDPVVDNTTFVITKTDAAKFFTETAAGNPTIIEEFGYIFGFQNGSANLPVQTTWGQGGGGSNQVWFPAGSAGSISRNVYWTGMKTSIDDVSKTTPTQATNNTAATVTGITLQRICDVTVTTATNTNDTMTLTRDANGPVGTITPPFVNSNITFTFTEGVADTLQPFVLGQIYQRTEAGGWLEYVPSALNIIASGTNI